MIRGLLFIWFFANAKWTSAFQLHRSALAAQRFHSFNSGGSVFCSDQCTVPSSNSNLQRVSQLQSTPKPTDGDVSVDRDWLDEALSTWLVVGLPILSLGLLVLLQAKWIPLLVLAKRAYIYTMAVSIVVIASIRGASDSPLLGTRLVDLTREILPIESLGDDDKLNKEQPLDQLVILDEMDDSAQALGLPLLAASSLVVSLFFVMLQNSAPPSTSDGSNFQLSLEFFRSLLPQLSTLSNGLVLSLFARAELSRLPIAKNDVAVTFIALLLVFLSYLAPGALVWPIQNFLCMSLAIYVARAIQIPRLGPILLALGGLVIYDVVSVGMLFVELGSSSLSASGQLPAAPDATVSISSAMRTVAISKIGSASGSTWQPGLFQVQLRGITTDLLGLGDAVFPALLSTFCLRYDQRVKELKLFKSPNLFWASIGGFVAGCVVCEYVPGISSNGLPALLFIVPSMLTTLAVAILISQDDLPSVWSFQADDPPKVDS